MPEALIPGIDYTLDDQGRMVFTASYLLRRGYCCNNGCRNCPYVGKPDFDQQTRGDRKI